MIDGESSTLPVSERLQRLRRYSSNFRLGIFNHEMLSRNPDYSLPKPYDLETQSFGTALSPESSSVFYRRMTPPFESFLCFVTHGSAQAGIQSRFRMIPLDIPEYTDNIVKAWAIDYVQDLLVTSLTWETYPPETENKYVFAFLHCMFSDKIYIYGITRLISLDNV